jgi:hypothetical protein
VVVVVVVGTEAAVVVVGTEAGAGAVAGDTGVGVEVVGKLLVQTEIPSETWERLGHGSLCVSVVCWWIFLRKLKKDLLRTRYGLNVEQKAKSKKAVEPHELPGSM